MRCRESVKRLKGNRLRFNTTLTTGGHGGFVDGPTPGDFISAVVRLLSKPIA